MTNFIEVDDGYINLDQVVRSGTAHNGAALFYNIKDELVGTRRQGISNVKSLAGDTVPARAGDTATIITLYRDTDNRPDENDVGVSASYSPARAIGVPVLAELLANNSTDLPNGKLMDVSDEAMYDTLDDAKAYLLNVAKVEWDQRAAKKKAGETGRG